MMPVFHTHRFEKYERNTISQVLILMVQRYVEKINSLGRNPSVEHDEAVSGFYPAKKLDRKRQEDYVEQRLLPKETTRRYLQLVCSECSDSGARRFLLFSSPFFTSRHPSLNYGRHSTERGAQDEGKRTLACRRPHACLLLFALG